MPRRLRGWGPEAGGELCQGALTQKRTLGARFDVEAHFRLLICVVLRREAIAEAPAAPSLLLDRLSVLSCVK